MHQESTMKSQTACCCNHQRNDIDSHLAQRQKDCDLHPEVHLDQEQHRLADEEWQDLVLRKKGRHQSEAILPSQFFGLCKARAQYQIAYDHHDSLVDQNFLQSNASTFQMMEVQPALNLRRWNSCQY